MVEVEARCADSSGANTADGSVMYIWSEHPDAVKLQKNKAEVSQAEKKNQATVQLVTGSGTGHVLNYLICKKAEVTVDVKTRKTPGNGSFEASASRCECDLTGDDDCAGYAAQLEQIASECANNQTISLKFKNGELERVKIKGKGDVTISGGGR